MISIKQYLEQTQTKSSEGGEQESGEAEDKQLLPSAVAAYRSALAEMGNSALDVCPVLGEELKQSLSKMRERLGGRLSSKSVEQMQSCVREQLREWGRRVAAHYRQKTIEVKELLLVMARAAESVGERDQRCAQQITAVTMRLKSIANLEDLTEIRESIARSAQDLKCSIDRMTAEGSAALEQLRAEVSNYQSLLEEAEEVAARDALTGLHSRLWVEGQIEQSLHAGAPFCVAILDINDFKHVNDAYGHLVGDEVLKQFSARMRSVCRTTDAIGRWGGDEFILLLHCRVGEARAQMDRMREWVCGKYTLQGCSAPLKLRVDASIGLAERQSGETIRNLIDRADAAMYREKTAAQAG